MSVLECSWLTFVLIYAVVIFDCGIKLWKMQERIFLYAIYIGQKLLYVLDARERKQYENNFGKYCMNV